ncbi:hypothetical protein BJX76DRAFT_341164 [Aspergillus varians]
MKKERKRKRQKGMFPMSTPALYPCPCDETQLTFCRRGRYSKVLYGSVLCDTAVLLFLRLCLFFFLYFLYFLDFLFFYYILHFMTPVE